MPPASGCVIGGRPSHVRSTGPGALSLLLPQREDRPGRGSSACGRPAGFYVSADREHFVPLQSAGDEAIAAALNWVAEFGGWPQTSEPILGAGFAAV
jgi:hypothetical protein